MKAGRGRNAQPGRHDPPGNSEVNNPMPNDERLNHKIS
jgi:hypothetical protein